MIHIIVSFIESLMSVTYVDYMFVAIAVLALVNIIRRIIINY